MKRCPNCGFSNDDHLQICTKCGGNFSQVSDAGKSVIKPVQQSSNASDDLKKTRREPVQDAADDLRKTKAEHNQRNIDTVDYVIPQKPDVKTENNSSDSRTCDSCGYILMSSTQSCPRCSKEFEKVDLPDEKPATSKESPFSEPVKPATPHNATINPWMKKAKEAKIAKFTLTNISWEAHEQHHIVEFTGPNIELNKESLKSDSDAISGTNQAKVELVDGEWQVTDTSSHQTTFIQVAKPYKLQDGDVLLIGDELFKFNKV